MSNSKPLPPFTFEVLCYLNRDQLERFSIVCIPLKNFIDRYFHSKPYHLIDELFIRAGSYALRHNYVNWHPNRDGYSVQQLLVNQKCSFDNRAYYSFDVIHPYLVPTVRFKRMIILIAGNIIYNPEHVAEMESIANLWRDGRVCITLYYDIQIPAEDFLPILNSPIILQCRELTMRKANFSFKDYKVLYSVNVIDIEYFAEDEIDSSYWTEFLEQPGAFSSAAVPNAFKIVFPYVYEPLTEFQETNKTSGEKLELKKGPPTNCESIHAENFDKDCSYTLERYSI